ncbi:tRNA pseudouridine(55) synthase TruB [Streptococcus sobrinus]|uniref:tRNA pseudouridine synthase B n=1 Tax=Streptococcus sobrinus W1703 TaxID=1227275 RepID=U2KIM1_9STRE|nr:tRNA pseudouridine(55) synthase TruB [Streptococcus sobrinus]AWN61454.1 tRNA pseudouridine(55) synthase TruB [Streptococcus sobrinus]AWN63327.1 tRNA pseudouridine(55) synthase TruB [Streptococcus sobrinus]ERJ74678.1 tRNA pseudouridine synthase B [Streptococcus sobrinus W1703]SQG19760.1 tRNA pseudouridine synthase B [Streptococcus sobrinus]
MINGIINLKKEAGMTSHDAVFKLRKILGEKKIGHGGTLDPDVTGVLPIAVGKATRVLEYMTESGKVYEGQITLGYSTTTEDASGELVRETPVTQEQLTEEAVDQAMATFLGEITQVPPMYSAIKVNGRRLYDYARAGEEVERPHRQVTISEFARISPLSFENGLCRFDFRVACSKGTYVRTLAVDLGVELGLASHMSALRRTASAGLVLEKSFSLAEIADQLERGEADFLLPLEYGVLDLPRVELEKAQKTEISFGRFIRLDSQEAILAAFYEDRVQAILERRGYLYKPRKVLI